ncbi:hypothetical protein BLS_006610 [Venturia inaequalis]|uniref:Uncharacterized protein n=1 Tax=Venturia inaequalis TaxID=5025 RepID=A0A8H3UCE8_VENIN|nr:hypothetical protein BLS_006610 [Venturia inaequalis]
MANLALHAIAMGADKIPDKAFHAVPGGFFRPSDEENPLKKKKKKKREPEKNTDGARDSSHSRDRTNPPEKQRAEGGDRSTRNRDRDRKKAQHSYEDSESESDTTEDEEADIEQQPRRRNRKYRPSSQLDRGYSSDGNAMTHDQYRPLPGSAPPPANYFPPPPVAPVDEDLFQPKKYSPTEYGASPGERDQYYTDHPKEQQPYPAAFQEPPPPTAENMSTKRSMPADIEFARAQAPSPTPTTYLPQQPMPQVQPQTQQQMPFRSRPIGGGYIPHAEYMAPQTNRPYAAGAPPAFVPAPTFANGPAPRVFQPQPAGYPTQPSYIPPTDVGYKSTKERDRERTETTTAVVIAIDDPLDTPVVGTLDQPLSPLPVITIGATRAREATVIRSIEIAAAHEIVITRVGATAPVEPALARAVQNLRGLARWQEDSWAKN